MSEFFRYPHTPHLAWLGSGAPRDDKVLSRAEVSALLAGEVIVEEKLDGANLGISLAPEGGLRAQNRGHYVTAPYLNQFTRLPGWLAQHGPAIEAAITQPLILFGEWCAARHSVGYTDLPDWFLLFDVYDREAGRFWSQARRNELAARAGLPVVPLLHRGRATLASLKALVGEGRSRYADGPLEGAVVRRDEGDWNRARAKLVRADFTQAIEQHWRSRSIEWNRLSRPS